MVIYADLNHLKQINDTCGHAAGDDALVETAQLLRDTFRDSDIVGRIGGDEFVILAMETTATSEETIRRRLADKLAVHNLGRHISFPLSISLGVAHFDPAKPCSFDELLIEADQRMYADKRRRVIRKA
jgi:two-component system, cell cycle response regulator